MPLIALNAVLALALAAVVMGPSADAQRGEARDQRRGDYAAIAATAQGVAGQTIVLIDAANADMVVLQWNRSRNTFEVVGNTDLAEDLGRDVTGGGR